MPASPDILVLVAGTADGGQRLDRLVTARASEPAGPASPSQSAPSDSAAGRASPARSCLSRSRVQALIRSGALRIDGATVRDPGHRVKPGERIEVALPEPEAAEPSPEPIPLAVVHEDEHLIVVDKPVGLVVHPAAGHVSGTLVNALLAHCGDSLSGIGGVRRPGIVHRLDKDTSGLLVVAKTDAAHHGLAAQFEAHGRDGRLARRYLALAWGVPGRPAGRIEASLDRSRHDRTEMAVVREGGREAVTHWTLEQPLADAKGQPVASLLQLTLETGRTHQIRVHLAHIGHPVMGDPVYGVGFRTRASRLGEAARAALDALPGQALHAAVLGFEHPATGERLLFESDPPASFNRLLATLSPHKTAQRPTAVSKSGKNRRRKG